MSFQTFTVLVVEDLITDRELYRRILGQDSSCVYSLLEAESVAAGLALCQSQSIDAVLLDHRLPDGSGLDFLERLLAQSNGSSPPVVMISGYGNERIATQAIKMGAEDYLVKRELTTELLLVTLRNAIENTRLRSQLQQQKEQITTIWESMTDAYATLDPDWRIVYTNSAATEIFFQTSGLTPAEYLGKTHWDVFPSTVGTIVEQEYRRAVADRVAVNFELFYEPTNTWFETHAYPSEVGLSIYFRDINERKWLECERIAAEQDRDRFFDLSIDLMGVVNLDGYIARANPAYEQVLGLTGPEIIARPFMDFVHPDDQAAASAVYESLKAGDVVVDFEVRFGRDESYRWILWNAVLDSGSQLIYANGRDITDRKRNEERLRQSEELTRRILESNRDCIKVLDLAGRLVYINDYGQLLLEIDDVSAIVGNPWIDFWQGHDRELAQTAFNSASAGEVHQFEGYAATHKGTPKWWEVIVTPILDADGQVSQILSVSRDVTDRKQAALLLQTQQATIQQQLGEIESIYQMAPVGLCLVDTDLRYVRINKQLAQTNGLSVAEHIGKTFREVLPEVADTIEPTYQQVMESGQPIIELEVTGTNRAQPGVERCWLTSFYPQTDEQGRVIGVNNVVLEITDRKQAEIALQIGEELFRSTFENTSVGMAHVAIDGPWIRVNHKLCEILGYSPAELLATTYQAITLPADADQDVAVVERLLNGEINEWTLEKRYIHKQGHYVWANLNVSLVRTIATDTQLGIPQYFIAVIQDITDRKQLESQLRQRESQLRLFVEHAPAGVAMFDREMRYIVASQIWLDCHDLRGQNILGLSHYDLYPNLPQEWKEIHQRCLAGATEHCEEDLFPRPDGLLDWVRWEIRPWYTDIKDEIGGIIMFSEIITDRKQAEAALRSSERMRQFMFEQTFEMIGLVDLNGIVLEVNQSALDSIAAVSSEIVGQKFWETPWWTHSPELQQQLIDAIDRAAKGEVMRYEVPFPDASGNIMTTDFSLKPLFDEGGQIVKLIAEGHDITDRKQAQTDLEERNKELNSFVYIVSHDLKAPLRAVSNLSQWIEDDLDGQLSNDNQVQMNLLRSRVDRMSLTIDGLLDYARCGYNDEDIELVEMARLLADVIDSVDPPPTFTIDLPAELPTLFAKRLPLFQVLVNLIGNGIKHHHSEAGTIQISVEDHGDFYEFAIADNGPGIAPEHQEQMFQIFQAVNPQNRSDSTGIGLAIVKKTIEAEGGRIWLESELGKGTTFYFTWFQR